MTEQLPDTLLEYIELEVNKVNKIKKIIRLIIFNPFHYYHILNERNFEIMSREKMKNFANYFIIIDSGAKFKIKN